jgi:phage terminase large subunit-like protein
VQFGWRRQGRFTSAGKPAKPAKSDPRRFSKAYWEVARKNAKSTLLAAASLYGLTCEGEVGPQILIGATSGEQAQKVFGPARRMAEKTATFRSAFGVQVFARSITCTENSGFIQPINAKASTQDGWNPSWSILDELHAHKNRHLFDVMYSASGARDNSLMWTITTAGYDQTGVCYEERSALVKVLEGVIEADHIFGIIFCLDEGDDAYDEKNWMKANPSLPVTPKIEKLREAAADAIASPGSDGEFRTKRLNEWRNAASAWLSTAQWAACGDPSLDWSDFAGLDCWIGGDLADKDDVTALALIAFDASGCLLLKPKLYLPNAVLESRRSGMRKDMVAQYKTWSDAGHLDLTPGDFVDHNVVEAQVRDWLDTLSARRVTFDQFAAAQAMASRLNEDFSGPDGAPIAAILHKKAANVTDAAKELEARVKAGPERLRHDGNPVLAWMASNVVVSRRIDGTILPKKESEMSPNKIDGIDAAVNALAPAVIPAVIEPSIHDRPELWGDQTTGLSKNPVPEADSSTAWDPAILQDMAHPLFQQHKARFERWQDLQED